MELTYLNKKPVNDILQLSNAAAEKTSLTIPTDGSFFMFGDNFLLLSKLAEEYAGKIDLIYIDPPFNTEQNFYISEGRANTISSSRKGSVAYNDNLSREQYLEFLRERLVVLRELLSEKGSIYLHIDYKVGHYVKIVMDEIFGEQNFKNDITRVKSNPKNFFRKAYGNEKDLILFYAKDAKNNIWNDIRIPLEPDEIEKSFSKTDPDGRHYTTIPLHAPGETEKGPTGQPWRGLEVPKGRHWRSDPKEFDIMDAAGLIEWSSTGNPRIKKYADEHKGKKIQDIWKFKDPQYPIYPTEKNMDMLTRIIEQSSTQNSIVLDCFAGSGSTLMAAYKLGRRWIGIDNSIESVKAVKTRDLGEYDLLELGQD